MGTAQAKMNPHLQLSHIVTNRIKVNSNASYYFIPES